MLKFNETINDDQFYSIRECASYLKVSTSHLYKLTSRRLIPHYCPAGKKLYFLKTQIDNWIMSGKRECAEAIKQKAISIILNKGNDE
jgi:excisionase family DNA binding protein